MNDLEDRLARSDRGNLLEIIGDFDLVLSPICLPEGVLTLSWKIKNPRNYLFSRSYLVSGAGFEPVTFKL